MSRAESGILPLARYPLLDIVRFLGVCLQVEILVAAVEVCVCRAIYDLPTQLLSLPM